MQSSAKQVVHSGSTKWPTKWSTESRTALPPARWTVTQIAALRPGPKIMEFADPAARGLILRVGVSGTKSWLFRFRAGGARTRIALGTFPDLGLADARAKAGEHQRLLRRGIDPRDAARPTQRPNLPATSTKLGRRVAEQPVAKSTTGAIKKIAGDSRSIPTPAENDRTSVLFLAHEYVEKFVKVNRELPGEVIRILKKDVLPYWGKRDARTISTREVIERLDGIVARGAPVAANRAADILGQMFKYGIHRTIVELSPVQLLFSPGGKETPRKRAFTEKELIAFLHGLQAVCTAPQKAHTLMVLLLTLQRRSTVGLAEWKEFDFTARLWHIPDEHDKERHGHILPLTDWAIAELKELKQISNGSRFVLPNTSGDRAANPQLISRSVTRLQERFQAIGIAEFTTHDLRRTGRTQLAKLGVNGNIAERIMNHSKGTIEGTYDVHDYVDEKRAALERWEKRLREYQDLAREQPTAETKMKQLFQQQLQARNSREDLAGS